MIIKRKVSEYGVNFEIGGSSLIFDGVYYSIFDIISCTDNYIITAICNPISDSYNTGVVIKSNDNGKTWTKVFGTTARFTQPISNLSELNAAVVVGNKLLALYPATMSYTPEYVYPFTDTPVVTRLVEGKIAIARGYAFMMQTGTGIRSGIYWIKNFANNAAHSDDALSASGTYISSIRAWFKVTSTNTVINDNAGNMFNINVPLSNTTPVISKLPYTNMFLTTFIGNVNYVFGFDNAHGSIIRSPRLYRFSNDFNTYTEITDNIPLNRYTDDIESISNDKNNNIYITVNRYDEDTHLYTGILYKSTDDGETWQVIRDGYYVTTRGSYNDSKPVNNLKVIKEQHLMYLFKGTNVPDVSFDNGETWQPIVCMNGSNYEVTYNIFKPWLRANNLITFGNGGVQGYDSYRVFHSLDTVEEVKYTKYLDSKGAQELVTQAKNYVNSLVQ